MNTADNSRNTPHVLFIMRALHPPWNEGTRVIGRDLLAIARQSSSVHAVSLTNEQFQALTDPADAITHVFTTLEYGIGSDYAALVQVLRVVSGILDQYPIQVAHLIEVPLVLAVWLRLRGISVVRHVTITEQAYLSRAERLRAALGWKLFNPWIDQYALSSEALRAPCIQHGAPEAKLTVLPPPLNTDRFCPESGVEQARRTSDTEFVIVYIGTLSPQRFPVDTIAEALRQAAGEITSPLKLCVFAPEQMHDYNRAWSKDIEARLRDIPNVTVNVHLQDLSDEEKAVWYQAADVFLIPFAGAVAVEPPLTLLEAMACKAVVVASPQANRSEIIRSGSNGFVFDDKQSLSRHLVHIHALREEAQYRAIKQAARQTILDRHSFATVQTRLEALWDNLRAQA